MIAISQLPRFCATLIALAAVARLAAADGTSAPVGSSTFQFTETGSESLKLCEGTNPVLVYNYGVISKAGVPADRARSTYVHPIYGLDGEVLTDDFPEDHYHHRGLFWAWPHVTIEGKGYDLWMLTGIQQKFVRWLGRDASREKAVLGVENGWYVGTEKVVEEKVWLTAYPASSNERVLDLDFTWFPVTKAMTLAGAEGKSYGGLTLRFAPRTNTVITTPKGNGSEDLPMTRLPWADLSARFVGAQQASGAAVFIAPDHPDYPPTWLTRHYGVLCVGWPGVQSATFKPGEAIHCRYRVWIHRGMADQAALEGAYRTFCSTAKASLAAPGSVSAPASPAAPAQQLRAEAKSDRVSVYVGDQLFTEYLSLPDAKYPYFYPVNGPRTGRSVTVRKTEPYPHHSSLFFGCDRVNGGDYWQEGLDRGRIVSKEVRLVRAAGNQVVLEQDCEWERPGAESPFTDHRRITMSAPSPDRRHIDFDITLTARTDVRIEKNNHSLFSARVAPELSVTGGGSLVNSQGQKGEKETFGQPAPWADYRGPRGNEVEGLAILFHPTNRWFPPKWFTRDYGFFSPTPMFWLDGDLLQIPKGETIHLRYRVIVHADAPEPAVLERLFTEWSRE